MIDFDLRFLKRQALVALAKKKAELISKEAIKITAKDSPFIGDIVLSMEVIADAARGILKLAKDAENE